MWNLLKFLAILAAFDLAASIVANLLRHAVSRVKGSSQLLVDFVGKFVKQLMIVIGLILGAFAGIAAGQQSDRPRWLIRGAPDPAIIRAGDDGGYYVFSTGRGIPILHSEDLRAWEYQGRVFDQAVPAWARQRIPDSNSVWAPDIRMLRGRRR